MTKFKSAEEFMRRLRGLSEAAQKELRKELRDEQHVYYVKTYTVHAHFRKVPKRRRKR